MNDEEVREYNRLVDRCDSLVRQINSLARENEVLEIELDTSINNVGIMIENCSIMGDAVFEDMSGLSNVVGQADIDTNEVFNALNRLAVQYFTFKSISTASKNMSRFTDEYNTSFSYYNELRRITLGYVIGLDSHIISSETARKKVEKAYLQNTEYWLAYAIMAVMLWASDEKEASDRAIKKSLSINYFNTCLFFLLINLRFNRGDAAKKWYVNYLDRADAGNLGDEWQYLMQAYLAGAFGADRDFEAKVAACFQKTLAQAEVNIVDFEGRFSDKALEFAETFLHRAERDFSTLRKACAEYDTLKNLLSQAEKNIEIAQYYIKLARTETDEGENLAQRIEDALYSLISGYDDKEFKVIRQLKYNEAVLAAKGDISAAKARYNAMFIDINKKKTLGDMMLNWAFDEGASRTDIIVKRFSISFMKEWIARGFERFAENYRGAEPDKVSVTVDGLELVCNENDFDALKPTLERHYDKGRTGNIAKDKFVRVYGILFLASLVTLGVMVFWFNEIALTIAILTGLASGFLMWRRMVDIGKILREKKRQGILKFRQILSELGQWRSDFKTADEKHADLINAIEKFRR
jgi:hypothetical protein